MDDEQAHRHLADSNIRLMSMSLKRDICDLRRPGALTTNIDDHRLRRCIPPKLQYACTYWVQNLQMGCARLSDNGQVYRFLWEHVLHWIESLSLMKKVSDAILKASLASTKAARHYWDINECIMHAAMPTTLPARWTNKFYQKLRLVNKALNTRAGRSGWLALARCAYSHSCSQVHSRTQTIRLIGYQQEDNCSKAEWMCS
jgi:hypothetical protein